MKKRIFAGLFFLLLGSKAYSQLADKVILNTVANSIYATYKRPIEKKLILFSIWVSTDKTGKIDSIYYSQIAHPLEIDSIVNRMVIKRDILKHSSYVKGHANSLFVLPILYRPLNDISAIYLPDLGADFSNLIPTQRQFPNKKIIVEKATEITVHETVN